MNKVLFPYKPNDCSGRIYFTQNYIGCSLCGTLLSRPDVKEESVLTVETNDPTEVCSGVRTAYEGTLKELEKVKEKRKEVVFL